MLEPYSNRTRTESYFSHFRISLYYTIAKSELQINLYNNDTYLALHPVEIIFYEESCCLSGNPLQEPKNKQTKKSGYYMDLPYRREIVKVPEEDGYVIIFPVLKGCLTSLHHPESYCKW